jgi:CMP-N-acetylneuraminic acid synthetase
MNQVTALVPMKGHSERVPNKNMKDFAGAPLFHRIICTLNKCSRVKNIVINTDSDIIKTNTKKFFPDVKVIDRPEEIQGDFVSMNKIIAYDLSCLEGEHFLQTHSTNPLLQSDTIEKAIENYFISGDEYDSVFSVTRYQTRLYWEDGSPINHNPAELLRTQDLSSVFEENSNFYIFSKESFKVSGNKRIGLKPLMFEISKMEAQDIDEPQDFKLAEILYKEQQK